LWSILLIVSASNLLFFFVLKDPTHSLAAQTGVIFITVFASVLMHRGHARLAAAILVSAVWIIVFLSSLRFDGVTGFAFTALVLVILMAGLLLGEAFGLGFASLSIVAGIVLYLGEVANVLPFSHSANSAAIAWFVNIIYFTFTAVLIGLYTRTLNRALHRAQQNKKSLSKRNDELHAAHQLLSIRANELSETNAQLQTEIAVRQQSEAQIQAALAEKELLLQEIHHRVKNNLQIIASLLSLQAQHLTDPTAIEALSDSESRVRSMAMIHEQLYSSDNLAHIDFEEYTSSLCHRLLRTYQKNTTNITLNLSMKKTTMTIDTAIPCGLLVNELVSNSLKHAFPNGHSGKITVGFYQTESNHRVLTVQDNGIGFPAETINCISESGVPSQCTNSLGLKLVESLVLQLEGSITIASVPQDTSVKITF
jgi:two-component sensor histidine kinase